MKYLALTALAVVLLVLHLDFWNWYTPYPLLFDFVPIGIWWQAAFAIACSVMMYLFVKFLWPAELEEFEKLPTRGGNDGEGH